MSKIGLWNYIRATFTIDDASKAVKMQDPQIAAGLDPAPTFVRAPWGRSTHWDGSVFNLPWECDNPRSVRVNLARVARNGPVYLHIAPLIERHEGLATAYAEAILATGATLVSFDWLGSQPDHTDEQAKLVGILNRHKIKCLVEPSSARDIARKWRERGYAGAVQVAVRWDNASAWGRASQVDWDLWHGETWSIEPTRKRMPWPLSGWHAESVSEYATRIALARKQRGNVLVSGGVTPSEFVAMRREA